jgi:uncharacterized protein YcbK (DUF882 family)
MIHPRLLKLYEILRENMGGYPLKINCAYRCPQRNAEVGGVVGSQHTKGTAMDIQCPKCLTSGQFKWYVENTFDETGGFDAYGYYVYDGSGESYGDGFIHVDVRNGGVRQEGEEAIYWEDVG